MRTSRALAALLAVAALPVALAFIPAMPVNDTSAIVDSNDQITLAWIGGGIAAPISRQLVADSEWSGDENATVTIVPWSKYAKGVLVHFSEAIANQTPSLVPWIAFISCDSNGTDFSMENDIFTLARDVGAQGALLYSLTSAGCLINQDYLQNFEKVLDVYATRDIQDARVIENQFQKVAASAYNFSAATLNTSSEAVITLLNQPALVVSGGDVMTTAPPSSSRDTGLPSSTVTDGSVTLVTNPDGSVATSTVAQRLAKRQATTSESRSESSARSTTTTAARNATTPTPTPTPFSAAYLGAVLAASNITVGASANGTSGTGSSLQNGNNGPNTGLAMIILYAITGVVTFMFLVVILSGAIRAIRHPERYGPRGGMFNGAGGMHPAQTRASGLTRAILDTFPVVKFGRSDTAVGGTASRDVETGKAVDDIELGTPAVSTLAAGAHPPVDDRRASVGSSNSFVSAEEAVTTLPPALAVPAPALSTSDATATPALATDVNPADVDDGTTCPICVCEFEDGEDVRILPCDARHRFHRDCIDPWLLQVSSLCPLCRLDLSGGTAAGTAAAAATSGSTPAAPANADGSALSTEEEADASSEQQVISNLRAMLHGHRASTSSGSGVGAGSAAGPASRLRFFKYVARRRQQAAAAAAAADSTGPAATEGGRRRRRASTILP